MVDIEEIVLGVCALAIVILVPIVCVVIYDLLTGRWDDQYAPRRRTRPRSLRTYRRELKLRRCELRLLRHTGVPIERVAADLRRLRASAVSDADRSALHQIADRLAYDKVLCQACLMLRIEHELADEGLSGLDREIERVRVEAALEGAGMVLTVTRKGQPR